MNTEKQIIETENGFITRDWCLIDGVGAVIGGTGQAPEQWGGSA